MNNLADYVAKTQLVALVCWVPPKPRFAQGQKSAQGILRLRNPNLGPNSGKLILDARISDPNSWVEFLILFFSSKRGPLKNSPSRNSPSRNSPSEKFTFEKFNPEMFGQKFTLHLCRAICQKRPFVHKSVCSQFLEGLFAIFAECLQFCLRTF